MTAPDGPDGSLLQLTGEGITIAIDPRTGEPPTSTDPPATNRVARSARSGKPAGTSVMPAL